MEREENLKELFVNFKPQLTPENEFVSNLFRTIDAIEVVKEEMSKTRRYNKVALGISSGVGFLCGVLATILFPYLNPAIINLFSSFEALPVNFTIQEVNLVIYWGVVGCVSVFSSLMAYRYSFQKFRN